MVCGTLITHSRMEPLHLALEAQSLTNWKSREIKIFSF